MFGDLSGISLEPDAPDPEPAVSDSETTVSVDGGTSNGQSETDPLDSLFDAIKRDVADSDPTATQADAGRATRLSDLVAGTVEDDASPRTHDRDAERVADVPEDAADLTASELFADLRDRE